MMISRGHSVVPNNPLSPPLALLLLKGLVRSLIVSFAFILLFTLLIQFTPLPERIVPYLVVLGMLVSILSGSMYVGRRVDTKGWLRGGITGLLYIVVILVLSHFLNLGPDAGMGVLSRLFLGFSFGCVGGMLGINS